MNVVDRDKALKIAIVTERFDPHAGGLERSTAQITRELAERGHSVTILAGGCKDTQCMADVPGVAIKAMGRRKCSTSLQLYRFVRWADASVPLRFNCIGSFDGPD